MEQGRMRDDEIGMIAAAVNRKINIPFINEKKEGRIIFKSIKKIDKFLWEVLPDEIYDMYRDLADGLDEGEAEALKKRLASIVNKYVDLPFLSEKTEKELFEFVIFLICDSIKQGMNLVKATTMV